MTKAIEIMVVILRIFATLLLCEELLLGELSILETVLFAGLLISTVILTYAELMEFKYSERRSGKDD